MSFIQAKNSKVKKNSRMELLPIHLQDQDTTKKTKKVAFNHWGFPKGKSEHEDDSDCESLFTYSTISRKTTIRRNRSVASFSLCEGDLNGLFSVSVESEKDGDKVDGINMSSISLQMLQAIEEGDAVALRYLLDRGADSNLKIGVYGISPLYVAVDKGQTECVKVLFEFGADPDPLLPIKNGVSSTAPVSPLRSAAKRNNVEILKILIEKGAEVNGRNGLYELDTSLFFESPLHKAAANNSCGALVELIKRGALVDIFDWRGRTPLHQAACFGHTAAMQILLGFGADPSVADLRGTTALLLVGGHYITTKKTIRRKTLSGYEEAVSLLLSYGAGSFCIDPETKATPLHQAVTIGDIKVVNVLLSEHHPVNLQDKEGCTPLHIAAIKGNLKIMNLLISQNYDPIDLELADSEGRTPIHRAAYRGSTECIKLLASTGADLSRRTKSKNSAIKLILSLPDGPQCFKEMMDDSVQCNDVTPSERNFRIKYNYNLLLSKGRRNQMVNLDEVLELPEKKVEEVLEHPLVESFLAIKWQKVRHLYLLGFLAYIFLVLGVTIIVVFGFCRLEVGQTLSEFKEFILLQRILLAFLLLVVFQEFLQMLALRDKFFREIESVLKIVVLVTSCIILVVQTKYDWLLHVAAASVFSGWVELMMLVGRLPTLGVYTLMFSSVAKNITKFLAAFSFLLIGFGLTFHILFTENAYNDVFVSLLRTFSMMTGDSEFENHFYPEDSSPPPPGSSHLVYGLFLILVSIVLMNLLIGLAVSDIQGLVKVGRLKRLRKQGRYLIYLENAIYSRVFDVFFPKCLWNGFISGLKIDEEFNYYPSGGKRSTSALPSHILENSINLFKKKGCSYSPSIREAVELTKDCRERIIYLSRNSGCNCDCERGIKNDLELLRKEVLQISSSLKLLLDEKSNSTQA
ncbi:transient receptor potential channel pyrexia-like [Artemia franciscana]|uniref:Ion transport domain-containing protein n=1 Tax=Artemia franciscana TaxID=6661 RepID=A0AA88I0H5_ARTSF|nr:hypothetical protein QYM36_006151 [Artemia franciscana]KAK2719030.1 hypothetical protein QYM36_006151 [Artemia franciscana]